MVLHLGLPQLVDRRLALGDAPGRANTGDKLMTLVASALAGGDCIDDDDCCAPGSGPHPWRHGQGTLHPPLSRGQALGTFLRSFRWGHVRQLDRVSRELLAWAAGAGPGDGPFTIDLDSTISRPTVWTRRAPATTACPVLDTGATPVPGAITRVGHRRHAEIENAIRDLKYGVGLNHLPSGRFAANAAWLAAQVMAHNLARWTARIGLGEQIVTTKTLRRRFFSLAGRLTRSARRLTLHLPRRWPWENQFSRALARLQAIPLPA